VIIIIATVVFYILKAKKTKRIDMIDDNAENIVMQTNQYESIVDVVQPTNAYGDSSDSHCCFLVLKIAHCNQNQ
jgi:hypothetical protein